MKTTYALLGHPLGHSFSRAFFTEKFAREGIDAEYINCDLESIDGLQELLVSHPNLRGFNVTIPYKQDVIPYLDCLSPEAREIGAVNVVRIGQLNDSEERPLLFGFNSDIIGFMDSIRPLLKPHHKRALVLGTGGASKAICKGLNKLGIGWCYVTRSTNTSDFKGLALNYKDLTPGLMRIFTVIINCTPLGMHPKVDACPDLPYEALTPQHLLYDLVYNPEETLFMRKGREQGAVVKNGLEMLHLQALASWDFWNRPLVTIGIPAYKAKHLEESIASALAQTYSNIEVVVVNDCSPQPVDEVVAKFSDPRLHYFVNPKNIGAEDPAENWNECLRHANGEYFCLLCDDDTYAPTFVERMMELVQKYPHCNVFRSGVRIINGEGQETDFYPSSPEFETLEEYLWHIYRSLRRQTISEFMLRQSALDTIQGYVRLPYAWGADNLTIYHLAKEGGIASSSERLTTYRDTGENLSSDQRKMDVKLLAFKEYISKTRHFIEESNFPKKDLILKALTPYYTRAVQAHIMEADFSALRNITLHPSRYGATAGTLVKALAKRLIRKR